MSIGRHLKQEKENETEHLFKCLTRIGLLCVLLFLVLGCTRAKPPRTVTVPETPRQEQEIVVDNALTQNDTSQPTPSATTFPVTTTPTLTTTPLPTATSHPTTTIDIPTIGPTTTLSPPESTPHPTDKVVHTVKPGETLYSIAQQYDTNVLAIMDRNDLPYSNIIYVNQELVIPVGYKPSGPSTPHTIEHVVKAGESLAQLARTYRTTLSEIMAQNTHVDDPNDLSPGTKLTITVGTAPPARIHVVEPGQNLFDIANRYGVSMETLVHANGLRTPNTIHVGQRLVIPR